MRFLLCLFASLELCGCGKFQPTQQTLVLWAQCESNGLDSSRSRLGGTLVSSPTFAAGRVGLAATFGGANRIDFPVSVYSGGRTGLLSICFWVKTSSASGTVVSKRDATGGGAGWSVNFQAGGISRFTFAKGDGVNFTTFDSSSSVANGAWRHVVWQIKGRSAVASTNDILLYIDGARSAFSMGVSAFALSNTLENTTAARVGADTASGVVGYLVGSVDDVRLYNRVLGSNEVYHLANP